MLSKGWHLEAMAAIPGAGRGVRVGVIDTGVAGVVDESWLVDEGQSTRLSYSEDRDGHGTHVAGVIASLAPDARILSVALAEGDECDYLAALPLAARRGAQVACLAGGLRERHDPLIAAAQQLWRNGVLLICAAGNEGPGEHRCPAGIPEVVTVGARRRDGTRALFSGAGVEIWAPGVDIWSREAPSGFGFRSGTSQAAAVVTGIAARLLEAEPNWSAEQLKQQLLRIEW